MINHLSLLKTVGDTETEFMQMHHITALLIVVYHSADSHSIQELGCLL